MYGGLRMFDGCNHSTIIHSRWGYDSFSCWQSGVDIRSHYLFALAIWFHRLKQHGSLLGVLNSCSGLDMYNSLGMFGGRKDFAIFVSSQRHNRFSRRHFFINIIFGTLLVFSFIWRDSFIYNALCMSNITNDFTIFDRLRNINNFGNAGHCQLTFII